MVTTDGALLTLPFSRLISYSTVIDFCHFVCDAAPGVNVDTGRAPQALHRHRQAGIDLFFDGFLEIGSRPQEEVEPHVWLRGTLEPARLHSRLGERRAKLV